MGRVPVEVQLVLAPYSEPVDDEAYVQAWAHFRTQPEGCVIVAWLHQALLDEMQSTCPFTDAERRSNWLASHDAKISVLRELCEAAAGVLGGEVRTESMPGPSM